VQNGEISSSEMNKKLNSRQFLNENCRRFIPEPHVLEVNLNHVFDKYKLAQDVRYGTLFTEATAAVHQRTLALVRDRHLSGE
jgi:hypothetical protein